MRGFFRWLLRALILVVVFLASALTAMRFAIHGRQTTVPKFVGLNMLEASRLAASNGLGLDTGDRYYSSDIAAGKILSQALAPGEKVRRGWRVRVAESMGPQRVIIPDLLGDSERAAEINIRRRGLEMGSIAVSTIPNQTPDQVVAQSPPPNATNVSAPKISVLIAAQEDRNSYVMPDLTNHSEDDAINTIVGAGLKVGSISSESLPASPGDATNLVASGTRMVVRTIPGAGQRVWDGQAISLEVTR